MWDFTDSVLLRIVIGLWNSHLLLQRADPNFLDPVRFMLVTCVFPRLMSAMHIYPEFFSLIFGSDWPMVFLLLWFHDTLSKYAPQTWKSFGNENTDPCLACKQASVISTSVKPFFWPSGKYEGKRSASGLSLINNARLPANLSLTHLKSSARGETRVLQR